MTESNSGPDYEAMKDGAIKYARKHKKAIARELTEKTAFPADPNPVSVFMAGSPGAGKTEASKALLERVQKSGNKVVRIDPDELRDRFEDYDGGNSWVFQPAISIIVDKIHDFVLENRQNFLLDGTLARYDKAKANIERSLKKDRFVQIYYVYQEPEMAWYFVKAREELEGRRIPAENFIEQYFAARTVVNALKSDFGKEIQVDLLRKNVDGSDKFYKANVDQIDNHIPEKYTEDDLKQMIERLELDDDV